jgi:hypothetical protein
MAEFDASWGTTKIFQITPADPDAGTEPEVDAYWSALVFPNERGEIHHGSSGGVMADTIVVQLGEQIVALADAFAHTLDNQYCYDCEYFLILRVRQVLEPDLWQTLPWRHLGPGDVFYAFDKFHGHEYSRSEDNDTTMSYGGDWADLQYYIDDRHPRPEGPRTTGPASPASLLRAVRERDVDAVRKLLAAGADPDAGEDAPHEALRSVSVDRETSALWEAISSGSAEIVEALLAAGARVRARDDQHCPALYFALINHKLALVPLLLRFGADPDELAFGKTPRDLAAELGPVALALLPAKK